MIVRDNERTIRPALESIRPWVDEMVVVDTGSRDKTAEIAAELGARVCHFPWCDDFSAARNESLRHARGRWIFWMDSDDTISPENGRGLRSLAFSELDPSILGFIVQVHFPAAGDDGDANLTVVDHVKLFRNRADLRFEGRIHEQVLPAISRVGGTVAWSDLFVLHSGYDHSAEGQKKKLERDLRLLHLEEHERPDHPFTLFNLGMTYADIKQFDRAIGYLTRSIEQSKPGESHLRKAYALLVYSYNQARQHEAAWETCQIGLRFYPHDAELRFRLGILLQDQGRLQEAVTTYREVLEHREDRHLASVDRGINGFKTRHNLAIAYADIGDLASAEEQWRQIVQEVPNYRQGWRGYGDALIRQKKFGEANELAEKLVNGGHLHGEGQFLRGRLAASQGNLNDAIRELEQANSLCPADTEPLRELCRLLFERGDPADAERWLEELVARDPEDASVHFNLGTVRLRRKLIHPAIESFEQSLRLRPDYSLTHIHLGYALRDAEKFDQSLLAFQRALQLSPGNPDATEGARQVVELQKRQDSSG
jgi:tetratricopeptide (TPR) repeat protein